jgi:DNA-directed RNA polymerase subunit RPC12/RpoP
MSESEIIDLGSVQHEIQCPHCAKPTVQDWPGKMILYAPVKCNHCGCNFVIALNEPRP